MTLRPLVVWATLWALSSTRLGADDSPGQAPPPEPAPALTVQEVMVVTPCRGCLNTVLNAPAAVTVVSAEAIESAPDRSFPELLSRVPGLNSVRTSVRDWNVTPRQATSTLSNSQLALVDGRSLYLDFIGVILWDMVAIDPEDVEQIEVLRGPASAVWGANAFTGVVNVITKAPRASEGSSVLLSLASFDREAGSTVGEGAGMAYAASTTLSRAVSDRLAYRVSGGYAASDPLPRPVGVLPAVPHPLEPASLVGGGELPADAQGEAGEYKNRGTTQPHVDVRIDQEIEAGRISYGAGIAGTEGIIHTGIGPFNLERSTYLGHARVALTRGLFRASATATLFGTGANNLLVFGADEKPLRLDARSRTYGVDLSHSRLVGNRSILTYGGDLRHDAFHISLAPGAPDRFDLGAYFQEELFWAPGGGVSQVRLAVGARVDKFGALDGLVFSPRLAVTWKPSPRHALRLSVNRAFRAPSVVNNYLDTVVVRPLDLGALFPELPPELAPAVEEDFKLQQHVRGDSDLKQESLTSYELGYTGVLNGTTTIGVNAYLEDTRDDINFTRLPDGYDPYSDTNPPPGWPLPPSYLSDLRARGVYLARTSNQFANLGPIRIKGLELFIEHRFADGVAGFLNYSWQPSPRPLPADVPFPRLEITLPPRNRVNAGLSWTGPRFFGSLGVTYAGKAFWVDVLPHDFDGQSPERTSFDAALGAHWAGGKITTTLRGTNLANGEVQPHVFGDIMKRAVRGEVRFRF